MAHMECFGRQARNDAPTRFQTNVVVEASGVLRTEQGYYPPVTSSLPPYPPVDERVPQWDWSSTYEGESGHYRASSADPVLQKPSSSSF
ncbi:unnamed protein product, partial [Choristocarpus tenellus]